MLILDVECYKDYFLVMFKDTKSGKYASFETFDGQPLNVSRVSHLMKSNTTISFNGLGYDLFMIEAALANRNCKELNDISNDIIKSNLPPWKIARKYDLSIPRAWDHIDLMEVAPGRASLKIYGGRLHAKKMQDLPIEPSASILPDERKDLRQYCANDLDTTELLLNALKGQIKLRVDMSKQYGGIDLRSKSDSQIAETIIKREVEALTGRDLRSPKIEDGATYRYPDPGIVSFLDPSLQKMFERIKNTDFPIGGNGSVIMPDWLKDERITIGGKEYQMGIGGLHSCEKSQSVVVDDNHILADFDVASYYPSIILKLKLSPESMGDDFLSVYQSIVTRRLDAKASGDDVTAASLKIAVNGSFGKLGSKYSTLYAPDLLIRTTITGQLCLLMLIERMEAHGVSVVSANTDGIVIHCRKSKESILDDITFDWMMETSFELERSDYRALHSRDVNNYVAVKLDGKVKRKGAYSESGLMKNPEFGIVSNAVCKYLSDGTPLDVTIRSCDKPEMFVMVRRVDGGAEWRGEYLGKAVRFYYSSAAMQSEGICYKRNGNRVPNSQGAKPLMELPDGIMPDIAYDRYIAIAQNVLKDMGVS
jgi:DNA polymerase elongation subunit (family B)